MFAKKIFFSFRRPSVADPGSYYYTKPYYAKYYGGVPGRVDTFWFFNTFGVRRSIDVLDPGL